MDLFKAEDVRVACPGVTLRMLDYWVEKDVIRPTKYVKTKNTGRTLYLFSFTDIVQIRIVHSLRRAGVSLQRIRAIIPRLRGRKGGQWQSSWLVTDGHDVFEFTSDPAVVESHAKPERGQYVFAIIALGHPARDVQAALAACEPFKQDSWCGPVCDWVGWRESRIRA